jgi:hypothetical protein
MSVPSEFLYFGLVELLIALITLYISSLVGLIVVSICTVGLWVLRPLLAYCTSPG